MPIAFAADAIDPPSNSMASAFLMHALNHSSPHSATMLPAAWGTIGTMVDPSSYGDRLAQTMRDADVSVRALADALGVSYQAVRKVTIGQTKILTAHAAAHKPAARRVFCFGIRTTCCRIEFSVEPWLRSWINYGSILPSPQRTRHPPAGAGRIE
jgi:hypothetical protein